MHKKISFLSAFLITLNGIIGAGLFVNTNSLLSTVGTWGFACYLLGALILLPIVFTVASLAAEYPVAGGLYVYSKTELGSFYGFLSGWSYFLAKTTSFALLSHVFLRFLFQLFEIQNNLFFFISYPLFFSFLFLLYVAGATVGGKIQYFFTLLKAIPILALLTTSFSSFSSKSYFEQPFIIGDIFSYVSLVVFAMSSFELICSITHLLENAKKNVFKVVLYSFCFVVALYSLFQFSFAGAIGTLTKQEPDLINYFLTSHFQAIPVLGRLFYSLIYCSILGTLYTILGGNTWNLFALAHDNHLPHKALICRTNNNNVPWVSMLIKLAIAFFILLISQNQIALQNMFVVCVSISYGLSACAAIAHKKEKTTKEYLFYYGALLSSTYLISLGFFRLIESGISFSFLSIYCVGLFLYWYQSFKQKQN